MIKNVLILVVMVFSLFGLALIPSTQALAAPLSIDDSSPCAENFLGFPVWYRGLVNEDCDVVSPGSIQDGKFIWTLAINIIEIAAMAVSYISVGFILMGGFKYLTSAGSADGVSKAKSTISSAILGLAISLIAKSIIDFIFKSFIGNAAKNNMGVVMIDANTLLNNVLNMAYFIAGTTAVAMIIFAGLTYATSAGDSKKIETAKNTITYSVIGLVVIILASTITWFVIGRFQ